MSGIGRRRGVATRCRGAVARNSERYTGQARTKTSAHPYLLLDVRSDATRISDPRNRFSAGIAPPRVTRSRLLAEIAQRKRSAAFLTGSEVVAGAEGDSQGKLRAELGGAWGVGAQTHEVCLECQETEIPSVMNANLSAVGVCGRAEKVSPEASTMHRLGSGSSIGQ